LNLTNKMGDRENNNVLLQPSKMVQHRWPVNMVEDDIEEFKDQKKYPTIDTYLRRIGSAWVSPDSVIYRYGIPVRETLASPDQMPYYRMKHLVKKILTGKKQRLDDNKKYLLVTDLWSTGHFHWFVDTLPKLLCVGEKAAEFTLILPDTPYIRTIGLESLALLQIQFGDIILMNEKAFYKIKNLYYISPVTLSGQMYPELMQKMQHKLIGNTKPGNRRIYISREKAGFRKVVNEKSLLDMLKANQFDVLYGEDLTLSEQRIIFSSCNTLLGIHGAGLTNCILMHPESKVIELRRKENGPHNVGYWHLADSLNHQYYYFNGVPDSGKQFVGKGCNLSIPIDQFEQVVLQQL